MDDDVRKNTSQAIKPEIIELAKSILSGNELDHAEEIIALAFSESKDDQKISGDMLSHLIPKSPKRPLWYVNGEVSYGPYMVTRYVVHYLCAFLNGLLDDLAKDLVGFRRFIPFGGTLKKMKGKIPVSLYNNLDLYNKIYFIPAKHSFDPYDAKDHLFSLKDAIFCCFVTIKLKDEILTLSKSAQEHMNMGLDTIKEKI